MVQGTRKANDSQQKRTIQTRSSWSLNSFVSLDNRTSHRDDDSGFNSETQRYDSREGSFQLESHHGSFSEAYSPGYHNSRSSNPGNGIPVHNLEAKYRHVFPFEYFNPIQTMAFNTAIFDDVPMVISSPTGSGKTVVFELAIIRLLMQMDQGKTKRMRAIYVAPVKALCSEKLHEWSGKFNSLGVKCTEFTGDTDGTYDAYFLSQETSSKALVVLTTPEKLDSLTRRWRNFSAFITSIDLLLIDEVHLLNEPKRGPTVEAVVSRLKTIRMFKNQGKNPLRIVACSATIPNACDIGEWISTTGKPAALFQAKEEERPVPLQKIVLGYPYSTNSSLFKFDINLNYKLPDLLRKYSNDKPTLIFCSSRKGAQQTASYLTKNIFNTGFPFGLRKKLFDAANMLHDAKLKEVTEKGVSYHHAGLSANDRRVVEQLFLSGDLPVLVSTSTLALGVNLPAHLVIVKSTTQIVSGKNGEEYSSTQVLQMIGRAGRPQFDTEATAIIMTQSNLRDYYERVLRGADTIESCLHLSLKEHLNAEVVLETITDVSMAVSWLRTTFLYIRALKNPLKYKIHVDDRNKDPKSRQAAVERHLYDLCVRELNALNRLELITMSETGVAPTPTGRLMARFYIAYDTMVLFSGLGDDESMTSLLDKLCDASEFSDVQLRTSERRSLNLLNKSKTNETIRFPMKNRITTRQMKINCLIQATLGCVPILDPVLAQECPKILRHAHRLSKCLVEYIYSMCLRSQGDNNLPPGLSYVNAVILSKCLKCQLWENTPYVTKQIERIGLTLSRSLVEAGFTSFNSIGFAHPQEIERACKRASPFGSALLELVHRLPQYSLNVQQKPEKFEEKATLQLQVSLKNFDTVARYGPSAGKDHFIRMIVIDSDNRMVLNTPIKDSELIANPQGVQLISTAAKAKNGNELQLYLLSDSWVGLDLSSTFTPLYTNRHCKPNILRSFEKASKKIEASQTSLSDTNPVTTTTANFDLDFPDFLEDLDEDRMDSILRELDESIFKDNAEDVLDSSPLPSSPPDANAYLPIHSSPLDDCCDIPRFEFQSPLSPKDPGSVMIDDVLLTCDSALDDILPELTCWQPKSRKRLAFDKDNACIEAEPEKKRKLKDFENTQPTEFNFDFEF